MKLLDMIMDILYLIAILNIVFVLWASVSSLILGIEIEEFIYNLYLILQ